MDPDECLKQIRIICNKINIKDDEQPFEDSEKNAKDADLAEMGIELAESIENLDAWIRHSGFLPNDWKKINL